jgi:hypothetical protein
MQRPDKEWGSRVEKKKNGEGIPPPRSGATGLETYYGTLTLVASPVLVMVKVPAAVSAEYA